MYLYMDMKCSIAPFYEDMVQHCMKIKKGKPSALNPMLTSFDVVQTPHLWKSALGNVVVSGNKLEEALELKHYRDYVRSHAKNVVSDINAFIQENGPESLDESMRKSLLKNEARLQNLSNLSVEHLQKSPVFGTLRFYFEEAPSDRLLHVLKKRAYDFIDSNLLEVSLYNFRVDVGELNLETTSL